MGRTPQQRNLALAALLGESRLSHASLARRINAAGTPLGRELRYDKTSVSHWLAGRVPRDPVPGLIAEVLTRALGREITRAEAGLPEPRPLDPAGSLTYPAEVEQAVTIIGELARSDVERRDFLKTTLVSTTAMGLAARDWLVSPPERALAHRGTTRVGAGDVAWLAEVTEQYRRRDLKTGGGSVRHDVATLVHRHLPGMLHGSYSDTVGRDLLAACADTVAVLGWLTYDEGRRPLAMRYYIQALRLARAADDSEIAAHILTRMSYLALDEHLPGEAVAQARAAVTAAAASPNPRVRAYADVVEARAHAVAGNRREALDALARCETRYDPRITEAPSWALIHDPAELSNQFAHVHLDLDNAREGLRHITAAIDGKTDAARRSLAKCHIRAARLSLLNADPDTALHHARTVATALPGIDSQRLRDQLGALRTPMRRVTGPASAHVKALDEQLRAI